jgi:hypothetical protein
MQKKYWFLVIILGIINVFIMPPPSLNIEHLGILFLRVIIGAMVGLTIIIGVSRGRRN